jgi:uncharacterized membrane protein
VVSASDLLSVLVYVAIADTLLVNQTLDPSVRALLGLPLLLFVPGYVLLAGLFPRRVPTKQLTEERRPFSAVAVGALRPLERFLLAFGVSVALVPILGVSMAALGVGFEPANILGTMTAAILFGTLIAGARRFQLQASERYSVSITGGLSSVLSWVRRSSPSGKWFAAALVVVAVLATGSLAYALVEPIDGETYTTMGVYTETENGSLVTGDYPRTIESGDSPSVVVKVENHEQRTVNYTLVGELQRLDRAGAEVSVVETVRLSEVSKSVPPGEAWRSNQTIDPALTGENLRVSYKLFRGQATSGADAESAAPPVYFSVNVTSS